jgi:hypothetical protein
MLMTKRLKISKDRKRNIVIWSFILTLFFDFVLIGISFQFTGKEIPSHPLHESIAPYYFTIKTYYTGPNYFPYADLSFAVTNQYDDNISGFHFFLSLTPDNSSWVEIPLTKPLNIPPDFPPQPNVILTGVGIVPLNGFSNVLYAECIFPPQGFDNATQTRILNSFQAYVYIQVIWTPQSIAAFILVSVALMSFIIQILDFWTKEATEKKEERKETRNLKSAHQQRN